MTKCAHRMNVILVMVIMLREDYLMHTKLPWLDILENANLL